MSSDYKIPVSDKVMMILSAVFAAALIIFLFLIYPTSEDNKTDEVKTMPNTVKQLNISKVPDNKMDQARWMNDHGAEIKDGVVKWYAAGSSSCPPVIKEATYEKDSNTVTLTQEKYSGVCTMDFRPVQQVISTKSGDPISEDVEVVVK